MKFLVWVYSRLLCLYPGRYRAEYGKELETVFGLMVDEAAQQGVLSIIRLGWRELRDLPGTALREHWHEQIKSIQRRKMENETNVSPTFEPASWREGLAAMSLFLPVALAFALNLVQVDFPQWLGIALAAIVLLTFITGLIKGLPRWSLPYTGMIGLILGWVLTTRGTIMGLDTRAGLLGSLLGWSDRLIEGMVQASDPWIIRALYGGIRPWFGLAGLTVFAVLIVAILRPLRPLYLRIRDDWTLISFGLYGATLIAVPATFDDYPRAREPYIFAMVLILAAGAWVYMRSAHIRRRALTLFVAMTLSTVVGAAGKAIIYNSPLRPGPSDYFTWQTEALSAVFHWGGLMVLILIPALLTLLPRPNKLLQAR